MALIFRILSTAKRNRAMSLRRLHKVSDPTWQRWACVSIPVRCFRRNIAIKSLSPNTAHGIAARRSAIASLLLSSRAIKQCRTDLSLRVGSRETEPGEDRSMCSSCLMAHCWYQTMKRERFTGSLTKNKRTRRRCTDQRQAKTKLPFLSRIRPPPLIDDGMFSGPILRSLALTWP